MTLTYKQQKFVDAYDGNATQAAKKAGYSAKTAYSIGQRTLNIVEVKKAIQARNKGNGRKIADRQARQKFWTDIMLDPDAAPRDRLKASELLGRSEADFTENVQVIGAIEHLSAGELRKRLLTAIHSLPAPAREEMLTKIPAPVDVVDVAVDDDTPDVDPDDTVDDVDTVVEEIQSVTI